MLRKLVQLELLKHRQAYLAFLLIILLGMLMPFLFFTHHADLKMREILQGVVAFSFLFGTSGAALTFSAIAASDQRRMHDQFKEDWIPVSPVKKIFAAYIASLLASFIVCFVIINLSTPILMVEKDLPWYLMRTDDRYVFLFTLHLISFLFTYWLKQPFLGAGMALIFCGGGFVLSNRYMLRFNEQTNALYEYWNPATDLPFLAAVLVTCIPLIAAFHILARNLEREKRLGWKKVIIPFCLIPLPIFVQPFLAANTLAACIQMKWNALEPIPKYGDLQFQIVDALAEPAKGTLLMTKNGALVRVTERGEREIIYPGISRWNILKQLIFADFYQQELRRSTPLGGAVLFNKYVDTDGSIYAILREENSYSLLYLHPGKEPVKTRLRPRNIIPLNIVPSQNRLMLVGVDGLHDYVAVLPSPGKQPLWGSKQNRATTWKNIYVEELRHEGKLAELDSVGKTLVQKLRSGKSKTWVLPGYYGGVSGWGSFVRAAFGSHEMAGFILNASLSSWGERELILCTPEGKVQPLQVDAHRYETFLEGVALTGPSGVLVISKDGHIFPKIALDEFSGERIDPLHYSKGRLWVMIRRNRIMELDMMNSRIRRSFQLPEASTICERSQEGIYFISDHRIYLLNWMGEMKQLGADYVSPLT